MSGIKKKIRARQKTRRTVVLPIQNGAMPSASAIPYQRLEVLITRSLAAYILLRSREPVSVVMQDLFKMEDQAATLVTAFCKDQESIKSLRGALASTLSFVPIGQGNSTRDVTPKKTDLLFTPKKIKKLSKT